MTLFKETTLPSVAKKVPTTACSSAEKDSMKAALIKTIISSSTKGWTLGKDIDITNIIYAINQIMIVESDQK